MNKRKLGSHWEQKACGYLSDHGYVILTTNYTCPIGEIDIIALEQNILVFIEVKYRKTDAYGYAAEAVTPKKQHTIRKTAAYYLTEKIHSVDADCRFDVVCIDCDIITLIKDAF